MRNSTLGSSALINHPEYVFGLAQINHFFANKKPSDFACLKQSLLNDKTGKNNKIINNRLVRSIAYQALHTTKMVRTRVLTEDSAIHHAGSTEYKGDNKFRDQLLVISIIKSRHLVSLSELKAT